MKNTFDNLVWLGAGSATEPAGLLGKVENALLIDAREVTSQQLSNLKSQYPRTQIKTETTLISTDGKEVDFTEYNLPEYSATNIATGIKSLLPGLKAHVQEKRQTRALSDIISSLSLKDNNNILVLDIPDLGLPLLDALAQNSLLAQFSRLYVQVGKNSLYNDSATQEQVINWLQGQGYSINDIANNDPDMPWITATTNPTWQQLQAAKRESAVLNQELVETRKQLKGNEEKIANLQNEQQQLLDKNNSHTDDIRTIKAQLDEKTRKINDQEKLLSELKKENEDFKKNTTKSIEKEKDLTNRLNEQTYRNNNMEHEVIKLEAQLELITNVLLREKAF